MKYIAVKLFGPFQAYNSNYKSTKMNEKISNRFPTKSAIFGMVLCGLGISRENSKEYLKILNNNVSVNVYSVKIYEQNTYFDYQRIGYDHINECMQVINADRTNFCPQVDRKEYLTCYNFIIILKCTDEIANNIKMAFEEQIWPIYLGKKNCLPSGRMYLNTFESEVEAINFVKEQNIKQNEILVYTENDLTESEKYEKRYYESTIVNDVPVSFKIENRVHFPRRVYIYNL